MKNTSKPSENRSGNIHPAEGDHPDASSKKATSQKKKSIDDSRRSDVSENKRHREKMYDMDERRDPEPRDNTGNIVQRDESGRERRRETPRIRRTEEDYGYYYGEHPRSLGREEYLGSNKRHNGLGEENYRGRFNPDYYRNFTREEEDYYNESIRPRQPDRHYYQEAYTPGDMRRDQNYASEFRPLPRLWGEDYSDELYGRRPYREQSYHGDDYYERDRQSYNENRGMEPQYDADRFREEEQENRYSRPDRSSGETDKGDGANYPEWYLERRRRKSEE
jgi:hypothetical protein